MCYSLPEQVSRRVRVDSSVCHAGWGRSGSCTVQAREAARVYGTPVSSWNTVTLVDLAVRLSLVTGDVGDCGRVHEFGLVFNEVNLESANDALERW